MASHFRHFPLGDTINGSPHSMCVSLPTMADVIAYEEKDPTVLAAFQSGYPRFFRNPLIASLAQRWAQAGMMQPHDPLIASEQAALDLCAFANIDPTRIRRIKPFWSVELPDSLEARDSAAAFLRHTGCQISSREAEAVLNKNFGLPIFHEERAEDDAAANAARIRSHLHAIYGTHSPDDIHLFRSGMNAFYAGFRALQLMQHKRGKDIWIQLGWLYVDTARILERFAPEGAAPIQLYAVMDTPALEQALQLHGSRVAGIVTEIPTNPLVQTPDLPRLRALADAYGAALILDPTLVSPHNVNVLRFADLHINSLTKYAASAADVMMGALALNRQSPFYADLAKNVTQHGVAPGDADLARMAAQIGNYGNIIHKVNQNAIAVAAFLEQHPAVDQLYWAYSDPCRTHFQNLQHAANGPGSILSFTLKQPLAHFYDRCRFVKSPSFGARFTMMCPFLYLAHYDLVTSPSGLACLRRLGISSDLIRLSVGIEPVDAIIAELDRALRD